MRLLVAIAAVMIATQAFAQEGINGLQYFSLFSVDTRNSVEDNADLLNGVSSPEVAGYDEVWMGIEPQSGYFVGIYANDGLIEALLFKTSLGLAPGDRAVIAKFETFLGIDHLSRERGQCSSSLQQNVDTCFKNYYGCADGPPQCPVTLTSIVNGGTGDIELIWTAHPERIPAEP